MITQEDIDAFKDNEPTEQEIYIQKLEQILKNNLSKSDYSGEIYCHAPDENGGWVHWTDHEAIVARLTAERNRFEAALGRACLVGGTTYLVDRAKKAEAERDAALVGAERNLRAYCVSQVFKETLTEQLCSAIGTPADATAAQADHETRILTALIDAKAPQEDAK